jgi:Co/Zn/Cd efflux system component
MNISLLVLYRRWHSKSSATSSAVQPPMTLGKSDTQTVEDASALFDPAQFEFCMPCNSPSLGSKIVRAAEEGKQGDSPWQDQGETGGTIAGNTEGTTGGTEGTIRDDASVSFLQALHIAAHPGCTCGDIDLTWGASENKTSDESDEVMDSSKTLGVASVAKKPKNLNMFAAMLHLITDLLRSILILGAAVVIQVVDVQHAERIDAACALAVGVLITIGSFALLLKVLARLCSCFQCFSIQALRSKNFETLGGNESCPA